MSEHLSRDQRDKIEGTIEIVCAYLCEFATDADLLTLQAVLSTHAAQLAHRLVALGDGMLPPSVCGASFTPAVGLGPAFLSSPELDQRRLMAQQEMAMRPPG